MNNFQKKPAEVETEQEQEQKKDKKSVYQSVRGMHDILPDETPYWRKTRHAFEEVSDFYGFSEIVTPIVEQADLFIKAVGQTSDIVEKEMYYLKQKSGSHSLVLRPENTASIVRAYAEHGMRRSVQHPVRLSYFGQFFRHERPQRGRYRQFWQAGLEIISNETDPIYDAQIILATYRFLEKLKLSGMLIRINSIGSLECRKQYIKKLKAFFKNDIKKLTTDQKKKLETNPLRLLDSKDENVQALLKGAPVILDCLSVPAKKHFTKTLELLDELQIPYILDHSLVRGLDYYTDTVFEVVLEQPAVAEPVPGEEPKEVIPPLSLGGGGRYDPLFKQFNLRDTAGVGAALGLERVIQALIEQQKIKPRVLKNPVFFVHIGDLAKKKSLPIIESLRNEKITIVETLGKGSLSSQLAAANKCNAVLALIYGQKEAFEESIIIRDMQTGAQETIPLSKMVKIIKKRLE